MSTPLNVDVNEIVNFNFRHFTLEEKQQLTASVTALSLYLLEKKGKYNVPDSAKVDFDDDLDVDACYLRKNIYLGNNLLVENRQSRAYGFNFVGHLENIAHEVCHFGQDADNSLFKKPIYDYNHFINLLLHPIIVQSQSRDFYLILDNFVSAFYYLQPHELEAQAFSMEVLEYIVNNCDPSRVDEKKLNKLKSIIKKK